MKKCPFCAEEIQDEAIVCRYCGRDLDPAEEDKSSPYIEPDTSEGKQSSTKLLTFFVALVFAVVVCGGILGNCSGGGGGGGGGGGTDVDDPKYDMYFECVYRLKAGGSNGFEAANRCEVLWPD